MDVPGHATLAVDEATWFEMYLLQLAADTATVEDETTRGLQQKTLTAGGVAAVLFGLWSDALAAVATHGAAPTFLSRGVNGVAVACWLTALVVAVRAGLPPGSPHPGAYTEWAARAAGGPGEARRELLARFDAMRAEQAGLHAQWSRRARWVYGVLVGGVAAGCLAIAFRLAGI